MANLMSSLDTAQMKQPRLVQSRTMQQEILQRRKENMRLQAERKQNVANLDKQIEMKRKELEQLKRIEEVTRKNIGE